MIFTLTIATMVTCCGIIIGFACWWPPPDDGPTVAAIQRRLAFENHCRHLQTQWPASTEAELHRDLVLTRLQAITTPAADAVFCHRSPW